MKLRFEVNQAEAFRRGINVEKSIQTIEVDPATLDQETRNLIADRLEGIAVHALAHGINKRVKIGLLMTLHPTFESLMLAIRRNEDDLNAE